jgi:hypothetical protein
MKSVEEQRNNIIENYRKTTDYPKLDDEVDGHIVADFGIMDEAIDYSLEKLESEINQKLANIDGLKYDTQIECGPTFYLNYKMLIADNTDDISHNEKLLDAAINVIKDVLKNHNVGVL